MALPDDVDASNVAKATGSVKLPARVCWSGAPRRWHLEDRREGLQVYEMVLAEGTDDDVRRFIGVDVDRALA